MRGKKAADVWGDIQSTAASAEQNYYFLLLFSACELRPRARLLSVAARQKETGTCFHPYSWILQGMAHLSGGHEPPQLGQIKHLWGLHPAAENMFFYDINVKRARACWNVLLPCGLFYTDFNYAPSSFGSLISARFSWSHIACPAVCRPMCGEVSETCQTQQILNCTRGISHLYQFSAQNKN